MKSSSDRREAPGGPAHRRLPGWLPRLFAGTLLWLSTLSFGGPTASWALDDSWTQSLGYAFKHNFQAGLDYIFTFGPLGYFYCFFSGYDGDLFYSYVMWQTVMGLCLSFALVAYTSNIASRMDRILYLLLLIVAVSSFPNDPVYFLAIIASVNLAIHPPAFVNGNKGRSAALVCVILLFLAVVSLTKFTHFVFASAGVLLLAAVMWQRSRKLTLAVPVVFMGFLLCVWLASGQPLGNIPAFAASSLKMAAGYSDAMTLAFKKAELLAAMASIVIFTTMAFCAVATARRRDSTIMAALVALGMFIAWKSGFVRQIEHSTIFFAFATIAPFFLGYENNLRSNLGSIRVLRYLAVLAAIAGLFIAGPTPNSTSRNLVAVSYQRIAGNLNTLAHLPAYKAKQDARVDDLKRQYDLPAIRAHVGDASVDIVSWGQGLVFLNELAWRPRPVFQSYAAFTPALITINGHHYARDDAPEFVIFRLQAIDEQIPLMNDNEMLKVLIRDYRPILAEKGYVLLERDRRGQGLVSAGEVLLDREIAFGESVDIRSLNQKQLQVTLEIRKSLLGQLMSLVFKLVPIYMEMETVDDSHLSYRVIPGMARTGFVINPLILSQEDFVGWYAGEALDQLATFRLDAKIGIMRCLFKRTILLEISEFETPPYPLSESVRRNLVENLSPTFSTQP